ncbi:hypothetical protein Tco_1317666 [Tanacetum coccineum]
MKVNTRKSFKVKPCSLSMIGILSKMNSIQLTFCSKLLLYYNWRMPHEFQCKDDAVGKEFCWDTSYEHLSFPLWAVYVIRDLESTQCWIAAEEYFVRPSIRRLLLHAFLIVRSTRHLLGFLISIVHRERNRRVPFLAIRCVLSIQNSDPRWRDKFFWVNASVAPIAIQWFTGKDFPQDSGVDGMDGDMVLETLLNDNPTRIRRYLEEFFVLIGLNRLRYALAARPAFYDENEEEMRLQDFIKVTNPFDVFCGEEKLLQNERPILERTADVVTSPSDQIVNFGGVPVNQVFPADAPPPHVVETRKRAVVQAPVGESTSKKGKSMGESSSSASATEESASKASAEGVGSGETLTPLSFDVAPSATVSKVCEFVPAISSVPQKWLSSVQGTSKKAGVSKKPTSKKSQLVIKPPKSIALESVVGSSYEATDDLASLEAGSKQLISKESSKTLTSFSSASTQSEPLVYARPGSRSSLKSGHIPGIVFDPVEDSAETPRQDRFYASMSVEPSVAKNIYNPDWELTNYLSWIRDLCVASLLIILPPPVSFLALDLCPMSKLEHYEVVREKLERRVAHRDVMLAERDAEIKRLRKLLIKKPSRDMAPLRFGFEGAEMEVGRKGQQVEDLKVEAGKVSSLLA